MKSSLLIMTTWLALSNQWIWIQNKTTFQSERFHFVKKIGAKEVVILPKTSPSLVTEDPNPNEAFGIISALIVLVLASLLCFLSHKKINPKTLGDVFMK